MEPITLALNAHRFSRQDKQAIFLSTDAADCYLRLALIVRGSEQHVFPAVALDDWGREKKGPALYRWLYEQGPRFPRAELFGFDVHGDETQIFLRDLELSFRYPCYVFDRPSAAIADGSRLHTLFLPGAPGQTDLQDVDPPPDIPYALHRAVLRWRRIDSAALAEHGWRRLDPR